MEYMKCDVCPFCVIVDYDPGTKEYIWDCTVSTSEQAELIPFSMWCCHKFDKEYLCDRKIKSRFDSEFFQSNNWLRMHKYAMARFKGKKKHCSYASYARLPFPDEKYKNKYKRYLKRICKMQ